MHFIAIGDNCIDYYIETKQKYVGGNALNFAVYAKQLEVESAYLGVIGNDENGKILIDALKKEKLDTSLIKEEQGETSITEIILDNGERKFVGFVEGVFATFSLSEQEISNIKKFPYVHSAVGGKCESYFQEIKKSSIISYDFSTEKNVNRILEIAQNIDYGFISYSQEDDEIRNILQKMCAHGVKAAVATLGENGSIAFDGRKFYKCGICEAEVVDTLGAGDSFIAGFMVAISRGDYIDEALKAGAKNASKTIQYFGAW
ncbi:MAG TPA: fructoselysine 6-kinase [Bacillaceae bacterium]|nr:fructoselysine 6-kinase [Bacillaceae bacterium]